MEELEQMPKFDEIPGNWLCLDFTHTIDERWSDQPQELLQSYNDLLLWGKYVQILDDDEIGRLRGEAERHQEAAQAALRRAIDAREVMYRIFYNLTEEVEPLEDDLEAFNRALSETMGHLRIVPGDRSVEGMSFNWGWDEGEVSLDKVLWLVTRSAADLLTSEKLDDVRACSAEDCRWLFLDTSKNHSRRWCDMKTCGNRAKARRHYGQKKKPIHTA